jgi:hypothetical protein
LDGAGSGKFVPARRRSALTDAHLQHVAGFPVERGAFFNFVASVGERDKPLAKRVWDGPWVQPADRETMLAQFEGWDERVLGLLKVPTAYTSSVE